MKKEQNLLHISHSRQELLIPERIIETWKIIDIPERVIENYWDSWNSYWDLKKVFKNLPVFFPKVLVDLQDITFPNKYSLCNNKKGRFSFRHHLWAFHIAWVSRKSFWFPSVCLVLFLLSLFLFNIFVSQDTVV